MANSNKTSLEWVAVRHPHKKNGGPKKESETMTHADARHIAAEWYFDGYAVELRRRRAGQPDHVVVPKFPLIDRKRQRTRKAS